MSCGGWSAGRVIIAQVGMLEQFLMAYDQFLHHLYPAAHIVVGIDHLAELHVAVHEFQVVFPKHFDFCLQLLNPGFVVFIVHISVDLMVQR